MRFIAAGFALCVIVAVAATSCVGDQSSDSVGDRADHWTPTTAASASVALRDALPPAAQARLAPIVSEVHVRAVHELSALDEWNMLHTPEPTRDRGLIVELEVRKLLKSRFDAWTTLLAVVPISLEQAIADRDIGLPRPYERGTRLFVFFEPHYRGPGDSNCEKLREQLDPNHNRALCGFAVPWIVDGEQAVNAVTRQQVTLAELEGAIERGARPRRPDFPDPFPVANTMLFVNGGHYGVMGALGVGTGIVAEVRVLHEGEPVYNTLTGDPPPRPPGGQGENRIGKREWDIRQVVEMEVLEAFTSDPALTHLIAIVPGEPDNPYDPSTGFDPPSLPQHMHGIVAFDTYMWPEPDETHVGRRALALAAEIDAAGGHAVVVKPIPSARAFFVGPYAIEMGHVRLVEDLRQEARSTSAR